MPPTKFVYQAFVTDFVKSLFDCRQSLTIIVIVHFAKVYEYLSDCGYVLCESILLARDCASEIRIEFTEERLEQFGKTTQKSYWSIIGLRLLVAIFVQWNNVACLPYFW